MSKFGFDCKKCGKSVYPINLDVYKEAYEGHDHCLSCREPVSIEREAWDGYEKMTDKPVEPMGKSEFGKSIVELILPFQKEIQRLTEERDDLQAANRIAQRQIEHFNDRAIKAEQERRDLDGECDRLGRDKARIANEKADLVARFKKLEWDRDAYKEALNIAMRENQSPEVYQKVSRTLSTLSKEDTPDA